MLYPCPANIRDEGFRAAIIEDAVAALGGLDILVNNAAWQRPHKSLSNITTEDFEWTFKTNDRKGLFHGLFR